MTPPAIQSNVVKVTESLKPLLVPIDTLTPLEGNPRRGHVESVKASYARFGQLKPIVARKRGTTNEVIAGNHQLIAARELGWTEIAVAWMTGSEAESRAFALADNRTADLGDYDLDDLLAMLDSVRNDEALLAATGYNTDDLDALLASTQQPEAEPDDVPETPTDPISQPGDIWELGPHRIACGSATDVRLVEKLMDGERASMIFTDPPYGISYEGSVNGTVAGDDKRRDDLAALLREAFQLQNAHAEVDAAWYIWHAMVTREDFIYAMQRAGLEEITTIIWTKLSGNLGWSDYRPAYEPCFYASRAGEQPAFYGDRTNESVWRIASTSHEGRVSLIGPGIVVSDGDGHELMVSTKVPKTQRRHVRTRPDEAVYLVHGDESGNTAWEVSRESNLLHPTQKPVELVARAIRNSSRGNQIVLDSFAGSGSTLIGAELTGRRARCVELEPAIVDVVCARWEALSGLKRAKAT